MFKFHTTITGLTLVWSRSRAYSSSSICPGTPVHAPVHAGFYSNGGGPVGEPKCPTTALLQATKHLPSRPRHVSAANLIVRLPTKLAIRSHVLRIPGKANLRPGLSIIDLAGTSRGFPSFSAYRRNSLSNGHAALTKIPC